MKSGESVVAVDTPDVKMVYSMDFGNLFEVLSKFGDGNMVGSFFEKNIENGKEVFDGVPKDKKCDEDREDWIEISDVGEAHNDSADEDYDPAKNILEHMEIDGFLVERATAVSDISSGAVDNDTDDREKNHAVIINFD